MTQRDTFPFEPDKRVILSFLAGRARERKSDWLAYAQGRLTLNNGATVAWYAPDGSLQAKLANNTVNAYSRHVVNYIMVALGEPAKAVLHQYNTSNTLGLPQVQYFFDGSPIEVDQPFVLVGPVGMMAYRAALKS